VTELTAGTCSDISCVCVCLSCAVPVSIPYRYNVIQVLEQEGDWWTGYRIADPAKQGTFPKTFVKKTSKAKLLKKGFA
jgi:hypothetical protein